MAGVEFLSLVDRKGGIEKANRCIVCLGAICYSVDRYLHINQSLTYLLRLVKQQVYPTKVLPPNHQESPLRSCLWMGKQTARHQS